MINFEHERKCLVKESRFFKKNKIIIRIIKLHFDDFEQI